MVINLACAAFRGLYILLIFFLYFNGPTSPAAISESMGRFSPDFHYLVIEATHEWLGGDTVSQSVVPYVQMRILKNVENKKY